MTDKMYSCEKNNLLCGERTVKDKALADTTPEFWKENFGRLAELSLSFADNNQRGATIYGNGSNSVEVLVNIKVLDKNDEFIPLSEQFLSDNIGLCHYTTGADLEYGYDKSTPRDWFYRTDWRLNDHDDQLFVQAVDYAARLSELPDIAGELEVRDSELTQHKLFLSCNRMRPVHSVSAFIAIPGIGKFNCSQNGTNTPNNNPDASYPGGAFNVPSLLSVSAITSVDYSQVDAINVMHGWDGAKDINFPINDVPIHVFNGTLDKKNGTFGFNERSLRITPNSKNPMIKGSRFVKKTVEKASGGNIATMNWTSKPAIFRGVGGKNLDLTTMFIDEPFSGVYGGSYFYTGLKSDKKYRYYLIGQNDGRFFRVSKHAVSDEYIKIDVRVFGMTGWGGHVLAGATQSGDTARVTVQDEFGNKGNIKIEMRDGEWLRVRVNGVLWP